MEDFLGFLDEWENGCLTAENMTVTEKRKMCLSVETLEGLRITGKSKFKMFSRHNCYLTGSAMVIMLTFMVLESCCTED